MLVKQAQAQHYCDLPTEKFIPVESKQEANFTVPGMFNEDQASYYKVTWTLTRSHTDSPFAIGSIWRCDGCGAFWETVDPNSRPTNYRGGMYAAGHRHWVKMGAFRSWMQKKKIK